jgi:AcrR family transcriptional regulator
MSARREQLLDLAERVLEREGIERFGVNALAREAGIRPPSLYKHFSGATEIDHALIARWFRRLAAALAGEEPALHRLALAYRELARSGPQLYRLATERPLDRVLLERIDEGCERAAMASILRFFGETEESHDRARLAWASAHGLVSLEIAGRFPPGVDLDAAWQHLARALAG